MEKEIVWIPITLFRRQLVNLFLKRQRSGGMKRKEAASGRADVEKQQGLVRSLNTQ